MRYFTVSDPVLSTGLKTSLVKGGPGDVPLHQRGVILKDAYFMAKKRLSIYFDKEPR